MAKTTVPTVLHTIPPSGHFSYCQKVYHIHLGMHFYADVLFSC